MCYDAGESFHRIGRLSYAHGVGGCVDGWFIMRYSNLNFDPLLHPVPLLDPAMLDLWLWMLLGDERSPSSTAA